MRKSVLMVLALLATGGVAKAGPLYDFFYYDEPQPPVGGDCSAVAAAVGPENTWYGEFSGTRVALFNDRPTPFAAQGCFDSGYACRAWQNDALSYIGRGNIIYTRCTQGG
jgi:hypothetical protein